MRTLLAASLLFTISFAASAQNAGQPQIVPLWEKGAPGSEARRAEPEQHQDWWYKNIHNPSLTVFLPPAGKTNGTAVIVAAGGGHRELVFNPEGVEPAQYLASLGITAFALKYRLFREPGSKYTLDNTAQNFTASAGSLASSVTVNTANSWVVGFRSISDILTSMTNGTAVVHSFIGTCGATTGPSSRVADNRDCRPKCGAGCMHRPARPGPTPLHQGRPGQSWARCSPM